MLKQLTITVGTGLLLGLFFVGCDDEGVEPVQNGTGGANTGGTTGAGGLTAANNGGTTQAAGGSTPTGGTTGASTTDSSAGECLITPTADTGWVEAATNDCQIQGAWYSYNDCSTSPDSCTQGQVPEVGGEFPNTGGKMCTSGTTATINGNSDTIWGAGIGLDLNNPGTAKNSIATLPKSLKGFSFKLSGNTALATIRVSYPTATTESTSHFKAITTAGDYTVLFTDVAQGSWVTPAVALTASEVNAIQFQVVAQDSTTVAFDFCIENLTAIY